MPFRPPPRRAPLAPALVLALTASALAGPAWGEAPAYPDHADLLVVRDAAGGERPVEGAADWEARRGHILEHLQEVMGPLPGPERVAPLDVKVISETREEGYIRRKVEYQTEPGDRVPAWLLIPDGPADARRPAMLCLHQTIAIGKDEPAGLGGNKDLHYAKELALRGYVALAPDYPNFGEYKRDPYAMGYASASMKGIWNHKRAVDLLASLPEVDPERIGVIGHSLGGHNAIFVSLFEPRIKAVVSSCGFNAFPYYYEGNIEGWSHRGYMPRLKAVYNLDLKKVPFDFPELIGALAPRPFFTNSPLHDENFEAEGVRVCIRAARPIYALLRAEGELIAEYPEAEHAFIPEVREKAYGFLDARLKAGR
ncbi:alpha/beta fold hydrolase [Paludisphaera sp.]|uniref:alpha/beta fold hydrolase n=1 Tax=Paludisphaera sp. TaxID=2017432 RepID=UPI00301D4469